MCFGMTGRIARSIGRMSQTQSERAPATPGRLAALVGLVVLGAVTILLGSLGSTVTVLLCAALMGAATVVGVMCVRLPGAAAAPWLGATLLSALSGFDLGLGLAGLVGVLTAELPVAVTRWRRFGGWPSAFAATLPLLASAAVITIITMVDSTWQPMAGWEGLAAFLAIVMACVSLLGAGIAIAVVLRLREHRQSEI